MIHCTLMHTHLITEFQIERPQSRQMLEYQLNTQIGNTVFTEAKIQHQ